VPTMTPASHLHRHPLVQRSDFAGRIANVTPARARGQGEIAPQGI
jgi:hypothetical protein